LLRFVTLQKVTKKRDNTSAFMGLIHLLHFFLKSLHALYTFLGSFCRNYNYNKSDTKQQQN